MRRFAFALLVALGLCGCGEDDNTLKGSMSQVYSLKFDEVEISRGGSPGKEELSVKYLCKSGERITSYPAKLTVKVDDVVSPMAGTDIVLNQIGRNGLPIGTLERIATDSTATAFSLKSGTATFDQEPVVGTTLSGKFFTTVVTEDGDRTLNGTFKAKVQQQ